MCKGANIAVVGMACRVPGAKNVEEFWENLKTGKVSLTRFSEDEMRAAGATDEELCNENYVRSGFTLPDVDKFDTDLFGYSHREAEMMDPQHRLFLECAWNALENAGCDPHLYSGYIGVFASATMNTYLSNVIKEECNLLALDGTSLMFGNDKDFLATRVSYKLGLKGPSLSVQTGCSSSLVGVHLAVQSLLNGECDMAMAGGVCVIHPQNRGYLYDENLLFSKDGYCRPFDKDATGATFGSGVGIVVLKRLNEAQEDRDNIFAVIQASAINNDGAQKLGFSAPSIEGQIDVIEQAHAMAELEPSEIRFVETHGTGTKLGDSVEWAALRKVWSDGNRGPKPCRLGAVKSNIGHLAAASGVVGLIKTILSIKHGKCPPNPLFEEYNEALDATENYFLFNKELEDWGDSYLDIFAGVSSFGVGGTNAHVVLKNAPVVKNKSMQQEAQLIPLSANSKSAVLNQSKLLANRLNKEQDIAISDIAFTLQTGRVKLPFRAFFVERTIDELLQGLSELAEDSIEYVDAENTLPDCYFVFANDTEFDSACSAFLMAFDRTYREQVQLCHSILHGYNIEINGGSFGDLFQSFIHGYALAKMLIKWGIQPHALMGNGVGEWICYCLADIVSLGFCLKILKVVARNGSGDFRTLDLGSLNVVDWNSSFSIPVVSTRTGDLLKFSELLDRKYWNNNGSWQKGENYIFQSRNGVSLQIGNSRGLEGNSKFSGKSFHLIETCSRQVERDFRKHYYSVLGELWSLGVPIDWNEVGMHSQGRRIQLPSYPFEKKTCWFHKTDKENPGEHGKEPDIDQWVYRPTWEQCCRLNEFGRVKAKSEKKRLIFFSVGFDIAKQYVSEIETFEDENTYCVFNESSRFHKYSDRFIGLGNNVSDYQELANELVGELFVPSEILYFGISGEVLNQDEFWTFTQFIRFVERQKNWGNIGLCLFTHAAFEVHGSEKLKPGAALYQGLMPSVNLEFPSIACQLIDFESSLRAKDVIELVHENGVLCNTRNAETYWRTYALRGGYLWNRSYRKEKAFSSIATGSLVKKGGRYLITGGTGKVGLCLAQYLLGQEEAKVVLLGRTSVSRMDGERKAKIEALRARYSELKVVSGDICRQEELEDIVSGVEAEWGEFDGVFHLAGITPQFGKDVLLEINEDDWRRCVLPKIVGASVLEKVFSARRPVFAIAFSSMASALGGVGYAAYASANSYLDAISYDDSRALRWRSINWDAWKEEDASHLFKSKEARRLNENGISFEEGQRIFRRLLHRKDWTQLAISTVALSSRLKAVPTKIEHKQNGDRTIKEEPAQFEVPEQSLEGCLQTVRSIWQEALKTEVCDDDISFFELGGDSLLAIHVTRMVKEKMEVAVSTAVLFEYPTVTSLSKHILSLKKQVSQKERKGSRGAARLERRLKRLL